MRRDGKCAITAECKPQCHVRKGTRRGNTSVPRKSRLRYTRNFTATSLALTCRARSEILCKENYLNMSTRQMQVKVSGVKLSSKAAVPVVGIRRAKYREVYNKKCRETRKMRSQMVVNTGSVYATQYQIFCSMLAGTRGSSMASSSSISFLPVITSISCSGMAKRVLNTILWPK